MPRGRSASRSLRRAALAGAALALCACTTAVRSGVPEHEADALILVLDDAAIAATKERGQRPSAFDVRVPRGDLTSALRALRNHGRLEPAQPSYQDLFGEPPLVPTPTEERDRRALALAGELAQTIEKLPGVARARVHLSQPAPRAALDAAPGAWRASIVVQRRAGEPALDEATLRALLQGVLDPLPTANLSILQTEAEAARRPEWTRLGPFTVAKRDASALRATLAGALAVNALLALLLVALVARKRARNAS